MAKIVKTVKVAKSNSKITKRELLLTELATLLEENFEQEVKFTKEGIVLVFTNEKDEEKDFVFRIVEKKARINASDFVE
ncbi:MAG: hypothetical protein KQ78_01810 [Candidatus Izimaplasma bacterium HR2]|nr:MAG: hypothetical protein KQ78_01810 [Candidatus Izimaplasma bacterium HR2]